MRPVMVQIPLLLPYQADEAGFEVELDPAFGMETVMLDLNEPPKQTADGLARRLAVIQSEIERREPDPDNFDAGDHQRHYGAVKYQISLVQKRLGENRLDAALNQLEEIPHTVAAALPRVAVRQAARAEVGERRAADQPTLGQRYAEAQREAERAKAGSTAPADEPTGFPSPADMVERHDAICVDLDVALPSYLQAQLAPQLIMGARQQFAAGANVVDVFRLDDGDASPVQILPDELDSGTAQAALRARFAQPAAAATDVEAAAADVFGYYAERPLAGANIVGYVHALDPRRPGDPAASQARQTRFAMRYQALSAQAGDYVIPPRRRQPYTPPDPTGRGPGPQGGRRPAGDPGWGSG